MQAPRSHGDQRAPSHEPSPQPSCRGTAHIPFKGSAHPFNGSAQSSSQDLKNASSSSKKSSTSSSRDESSSSRDESSSSRKNFKNSSTSRTHEPAGGDGRWMMQDAHDISYHQDMLPPPHPRDYQHPPISPSSPPSSPPPLSSTPPPRLFTPLHLPR